MPADPYAPRPDAPRPAAPNPDDPNPDAPRPDAPNPRAAEPTPPSVGGEPRRVTRYRVRRTPRFAAFLITGGILGAILGFVVNLVGPDSRCAPQDPSCIAPYQAGSTLGYLVTVGILVGIGVGAIVAVVLDWLWDRRG